MTKTNFCAMRTLSKIVLNLVRYFLVLLIILFAIAAFMGKSYLQTSLLFLLIIVMIWWPPVFKLRWNNTASITVRMIVIVALFLISFMAFNEPKSSIYLSKEMESELMEIYDKHVAQWPEGTEDLFVDTEYGKVHVLACGSEANPPLVMIHAASMGAFSWYENLEPLLENYRIYSIDNIGEGNKSRLNDVLEFPGTQKEIADHFASIMDGLGVKRSPVFGASNGGFVAMCYTHFYPERVESLALFGPMGLTQLSGKSIMMLSIATIYPLQSIRDRVIRWALGKDEYVIGKYGEWFNCMMKATIPTVGKPVPMTTAQKSAMDLPVLLFLGTKDQIVGDADLAKSQAESYPNVRIEVLESGHLIAVEHADYVNTVIREFLVQ
jgi:pimeloyl-ACP methyl ester carboxylesterase